MGNHVKKFLETTGGIVVAIAAVVGIVLGAAYGGFWLYKEFAPKYAEVEREVFENSPSFVQGKVSHLNKLRREYQEGDEGTKSNLREIILTEVDSVDLEKLPAELRRFIEGLK